MPNRWSCHVYTNIERYEEHAQYIERLHVHRKYNCKYLNLLSLYQYISKSSEIYQCNHFCLLNTVLYLLNIHIYTVNILRGYHNIVNNIEHVQQAYENSS